jgi:hypothetical protein
MLEERPDDVLVPECDRGPQATGCRVVLLNESRKEQAARFASTFSAKLLPIDLAIRDWSRRDPAVTERLKRVDNRRMEYLRSLFGAFCTDEAEVEARSILAFSLAIGNHFMAADHGTYNRADALELAVRQLLR